MHRRTHRHTLRRFVSAPEECSSGIGRADFFLARNPASMHISSRTGGFGCQTNSTVTKTSNVLFKSSFCRFPTSRRTRKCETKFKAASSRLIRFGTRLKVKLVSSSRFTSTRILFTRPINKPRSGPNAVNIPSHFLAESVFCFASRIPFSICRMAQEENHARDVSLHNNKTRFARRSPVRLLLHRYCQHWTL